MGLKDEEDIFLIPIGFSESVLSKPINQNSRYGKAKPAKQKLRFIGKEKRQGNYFNFRRIIGVISFAKIRRNKNTT